ncbi:hypothetical protein [Mycobacterium ulcerans]|nr:hypothetical protein [Mycobacterium ulcerans]
MAGIGSAVGAANTAAAAQFLPDCWW